MWGNLNFFSKKYSVTEVVKNYLYICNVIVLEEKNKNLSV